MKRLRFWMTLALVLVIAAGLFGCTPAATPKPAEPQAQPAEATKAPQAAEPTKAEPAAAPTEAPKAAEQATLIMAMNMNDVVTLDPAYAGETTNLMIHINTYDTLLDIRPDDINTIVPRLAEKWEVNPEWTEFTFHLRKDAKFASGNPVTAADVAFSWNRLLNVAGAPAFNLDGVEKVEAVDELTVKVTTKEPLPQFLASACNPSLGIQDSKLVKEHGGTDAADAQKTDKAKEWLDQHSAGSGPYILVKWDPKAEITLEANPNYWKGAPKFGKVVIKHVEDPTTKLQMLQRGDADMLDSLDVDLVEVAKADANITVSVDQTLDMNYLAMTSNCKTELSPESAAALCKKEVRQAVAAAIDYDGVIKAVLSGYGTRAPSIIPVGVAGIDANDAKGRDLEKAKKLLADAGYAKGLKLDLYYGSNPTRETIAAKLKSDLAEAGIDLTLKPLEQSVYLSEMRAQKLPTAFGGWTPDYLDVTMWTDYFALGDRSIAFRMWYSNPEASALAKEIRTTADPVKRKAAVDKLQAVLIEDMPYTMLYQIQTVHAYRSDLKGFKYHPVWFIDFWELSK